MNETPTPETRQLAWKARVVPTLNYGIALALVVAAPAMILAALVLALVAGDASVAGLGLLGGALLGATGGLALLWCLAHSGKG